MLLTLSLLPVFPVHLDFSVSSVLLALLAVLEVDRERSLLASVSPVIPEELQRQLKGLDTSNDRMLRDDIGSYAHEVVGQPILVLQVSPDLQSFPMTVLSFGDVREALSPAGMCLDKLAICLLCGNHYSLLVPTSDMRLGFSEQAYPDPEGSLKDLGHYTVL